ncbi:MAG: condensation domain-containing protein, partial [Sporichthyaceae bacterium]|nr:condensation domain-containing protein [Sporichthyaceae bacterium]
MAEAVVVAATVAGRQQLAAFVTAAEGQSLVPAELHRISREQLPSHLRPAQLTVVASLPKTPTGKLDRSALIELAQTSPPAAVGRHVAVGGPVEAIVSEVLSVHAQPDDSFLELGGDSISAIVVASRLQAIGHCIAVDDLMGRERLGEVTLGPTEPAAPRRSASARPAAGRRLPLTPMQQGVLFEAVMSEGTQVYLDQDVFRISGRIDIEWFWRAWQAIVARHESLRTAFFWPEGESPYRVVHGDVALPAETLDWRDVAPAEQERRLTELLTTGIEQHIDLSIPPLMRFVLVLRGATDATFIWYAHRLVLDGWSTTILLDKFIAIYTAGVRGEQLDLGPPMDYERYVDEATKTPSPAAAEFWRRYLDGASHTPLPGHDRGRRRHERGSERHENIVLGLPEDLVDSLERLCRATRVTLSTVFRAAWGVLMSRYAGRHDVVFGATNAGRPTGLGATDGVGLFINSLPVRVDADPDRPVGALLRAVQEAAIESAPYELTPLSYLQDLFGSPEEALFESLVIVQNYPGAASYSRTGALTMTHLAGFEQVHYPLSLVVRHLADEELRAEVWYDPELISGSLGRAMVSHLETILRGFAGDPSGLVGSGLTLGDEERETLAAWAAGPRLRRPARSTLEMVYEAATREPGRIALVDGSVAVSYRELVRMVDRAAANLRAAGVGHGDLVAVLGHRSIAAIATLLAVWRAGAGYLGLDRELPPGRIEAILTDSKPSLLVVEASDVPVFTGTAAVTMTSLHAEPVGAQAPLGIPASP